MSLTEAAAAFERGQHIRCEELCRRLLGRAFHPDAAHLLGLSRHAQGDLGEALGWLDRALEAQPGNHLARRNRARLRREALLNEGALEDLTGLLQASPQDSALRIQAAEVCLDLDRTEEACHHLQTISSGDPHFADAQASLAHISEQLNDDASAERHACAALAAAPGHFKARYVRGVLSLKAKEWVRAQAQLEALLDGNQGPTNRVLVAARLGEALERQGRYDDAFAVIESANAALAVSTRVRALRGTSPYGPDFQQGFAELWDEAALKALADAPSAQSADHQPIFLVGFPRSGTTLLDRILAAREDTAIIEEQPTLAPLLDGYADARELAARYRTAEPGWLKTQAAAYLAHRQQWVAGDRRIIVDKMPLNALFVPLLFRVFPRARFLVARRDPRDVCLSCFFQTFGLNEAMAQFLTWEGTAQSYAWVMGLLDRCLTHLPLRIATIHYESLVAEPESALAETMGLLGIRWDDAMLAYQPEAGSRINTPSYRQVSQGLYRSSVGRWKHYPDAMARVSAWLEPFVTGD